MKGSATGIVAGPAGYQPRGPLDGRQRGRVLRCAVQAVQPLQQLLFVKANLRACPRACAHLRTVPESKTWLFSFPVDNGSALGGSLYAFGLMR